jgi:parallel beta-helix repeat protein
MRLLPCLLFLLGNVVMADEPSASKTMREIIVTQDLTLEKDALLKARLIIKASHITLDGNGATLIGPGEIGDAKSLEKAGIAVVMEGVTNVTLKNLKAKGFATGLQASDCTALRIENCDFSDNYQNVAHGWGELPARGGLILTRVSDSAFIKNKANRVWDGIHLNGCNDNLVSDNDFSHCSNVCAKLWQSSRNRFLNNNLSYGIRIDRSKGEVHARDSTCVLLETGSDDNYWFRNDITHGGDGIFIRVLNGWVSRGNLFIENDTSYANNNCIESWSPGNSYIRNKANHGSYGFWLGGSDQTRLIGNEAAYNGLSNGYHHAPEPGFKHGGIVCVNGPGSHFVVDGNHVHHNGGGGIVFRGDLGSKGKNWRIRHWVIQNNHSHDNEWGIYGQFATDVYLANNTFVKNAKVNYFDDVRDLREVASNSTITRSPIAKLEGPTRSIAGKPVCFSAAGSLDPAGKKLGFRWDLSGTLLSGDRVEHTFSNPGFYRIALTVDNGTLADIGYRDFIVSPASEEEIGTEGDAANWSYEFGDDPAKKGRMFFVDDEEAASGSFALRLRVDPYPGFFANAIFPKNKTAKWDWSKKSEMLVWIKAQNPNLPGWQDAGPVITLYGPNGKRTIKPKDRNLLSGGESEARWTWQRLRFPLSETAGWTITDDGKFQLGQISAIGIGVDSYGGDPFTLWLDGITIK